MKRAHLGDSIDFWKRGLIGYLRTAAIIERIEVVPVTTDARAWTSVELEAYATILGVSVADLLGTGRFTQSGRTPYFNSLMVTTDVFVDPDTGVTEPATTAAHVSALECGRLLVRDPPNIVMVYQHAQRNNDWAKRQLEVVRKALRGVQAFAYQSSVVGMLFLTDIPVRLGGGPTLICGRAKVPHPSFLWTAASGVPDTHPRFQGCGLSSDAFPRLARLCWAGSPPGVRHGPRLDRRGAPESKFHNNYRLTYTGSGEVDTPSCGSLKPPKSRGALADPCGPAPCPVRTSKSGCESG